MVTLLADVKHREVAAKAVGIAAAGVRRTVKASPSIQKDRTVERAVSGAAAVLRPVITLLTALVELVDGSQVLSQAEKERYLDVVRAFLTDDDGVAISAAVGQGILENSVMQLIRSKDLFRHMHRKTQDRVQKHYAFEANRNIDRT